MFWAFRILKDFDQRYIGLSLTPGKMAEVDLKLSDECSENKYTGFSLCWGKVKTVYLL